MLRIEIDKQRIAEFCRRYRIRRLAFFGSVLRDDFGPESDVDVLVEFESGHVPGLEFFTIESDLSEILGRKVDLNTPQFLSRHFRADVLAEAEDLYAACRDQIRLRHMLEHAQEAIQLANGRTRPALVQTLSADPNLQDAR